MDTLTHTDAGWSCRTLTVLWNDFFILWTSRNEAIHGHDISSQLHARQRQLCLEMTHLHTLRDQVLAGDRDVFIGNSDADSVVP